MVLTLQEEVAERICNSPPDMNLLALSVQVYGRPEIAVRIPASSFFPVPEISSAVLKIEIYPEPLIHPSALPTFFKLTRAGFSQKRKTLLNALSAGLHTTRSETESFLHRANLDPKRRAETLSLEEWGYLINSYTNV
jgi:16S rRNA (adenine1518-N6/adenine1519-N6)-dimethyltransferase